MRGLTSRIQAGDEDGSIQRLLEDPMDRSFSTPNLSNFIITAAESRVVLNALWSLGPRSLLTGERFGTPFEQHDLSASIEARSSLANVVGRFVRREPAGQEAWAANRFFVLDDEPLDFEWLRDARPFQDEREREETLASHVLNEELVDLLARRENVEFLERIETP